MIRSKVLRDGKTTAVVVAAMFCMAMSPSCAANVKADPVDPEMVTDSFEVFVDQNTSQEIPEITLQVERIQEDGFIPYEIPADMAAAGGSFPEEMQRFTRETCKAYGIPYSLIVAMIEVESKYKPDAVSSCGAIGYMQIVEKWHRERMAVHGVESTKDPAGNILIGIDYMAELLGSYSEEEALVVYNCGSRVTDSTPYSRAVLCRKAQLEMECGL